MKLSLRQLLTLTVFLMSGGAQAALVNIAANNLAGGSPLIKTTTGAFLAAGMIVRIGTFAAGQPTITAASTYAEINALFTPIGESASDANDGTNGPLVMNGGGSNDGKYSGTISNVQNSDSRFGATTRLYIMILDVAPQADMSLATPTSWLIMSDPTNWLIPASATKTITANQISASEILAGEFVSSSEFRLVSIGVPEPGSVTLCLSALALMARRRRK